MTDTQKSKLIRFCSVCGAIFLAAVLCWLMLWRLDAIQVALAGMEAIEDDYVRGVEYYWVGQAMFLSSLAAGGVFVILSLMLEEPMLGPRPKREKQEGEKPLRLGYGWSFLLGLLVITLMPDNLFLSMYIYPPVVLGLAAWFSVWRVKSRVDYFPPPVRGADPGVVRESGPAAG